MNKYGLAVILAVFVAFAIAVPISLKYSQATLVFGLIAAGSGPVVIHRIPNASLAIGMLVGLSLFASFPMKKLFQIDGFINEALVTLTYFALLWVVGLGWKRGWR